MAETFGLVTAARNQTPPGQLDGSLQGGNVRVYREVIQLASQPAGDTIVVAYPSKGETFLRGSLTSTVSLGTSTVALGIAGATGKYRAAAAFTAVDTPTPFGVAANMVSSSVPAKLTTDEKVFITIGTAALPASGTLIVDLYFAQT